MKNIIQQFSKLTGSLLLVGFCIFGCSTLPAQNPIHVACVGDSITFGAGLKDRDQESYPVWLGRFLGAGWEVRNFGVSGTTLLTQGDSPWIRQKAHSEALAFKPDVVVIMLGTNDSKHRGDGSLGSDNAPDNWRYKADFVPEYEALIAEFRRANPSAKIYVCDPTPCFPGRWGINDQTIHNEIIPLVRKVARASHAKIINLYADFAGKKDLFPDTVHPNAAGAKLMAADIYRALTGQKAPQNP